MVDNKDTGVEGEGSKEISQQDIKDACALLFGNPDFNLDVGIRMDYRAEEVQKTFSDLFEAQAKEDYPVHSADDVLDAGDALRRARESARQKTGQFLNALDEINPLSQGKTLRAAVIGEIMSIAANRATAQEDKLRFQKALEIHHKKMEKNLNLGAPPISTTASLFVEYQLAKRTLSQSQTHTA